MSDKKLYISGDTSKCKGINCAIKSECFRFVAISTSERQSWSTFEYDESKKSCIAHIAIEHTGN